MSNGPAMQAFERSLNLALSLAYRSEDDTAARAAVVDAYREALEDARRLREFAEFCMKSSWEGCDIDGGSAQDKAEELGLIVEVPADEAFREEWDADTMMVFTWSPLAATAPHTGEPSNG